MLSHQYFVLMMERRSTQISKHLVQRSNVPRRQPTYAPYWLLTYDKKTLQFDCGCCHLCDFLFPVTCRVTKTSCSVTPPKSFNGQSTWFYLSRFEISVTELCASTPIKQMGMVICLQCSQHLKSVENDQPWSPLIQVIHTTCPQQFSLELFSNTEKKSP